MLVSNTPYLECIETLPHFLDRYNAHADTINQVHATVKKNFKQIEKQLQDIFGISPRRAAKTVLDSFN